MDKKDTVHHMLHEKRANFTIIEVFAHDNTINLDSRVIAAKSSAVNCVGREGRVREGNVRMCVFFFVSNNGVEES
jgi:hypothetical protein